MQSHAKIKQKLPLAEEKTTTDLVTLIQLEEPTFLWVAKDLTSPFEKRSVIKKDNKLWVNLGIETPKEIEWNVTTRIDKKNLKKLKLIKKNKLQAAGVQFVTKSQLNALKTNLKNTQNKIGFRYQGPELGWSVFAKEPLKQGDCISYSTNLSIKKNTEIRTFGNLSDYAVAIFLDDNDCLCGDDTTGLDSGKLIQHAYSKEELYDGKNWGLQKHYSVSPALLDKVVTANAKQKLYVFVENDEIILLSLLRLTEDIPAENMLAWNYGNGYWYTRQKDPQLFMTDGTPLAKQSYEIPKMVMLKPNNQPVVLCPLFQNQIESSTRTQKMTALISNTAIFVYTGLLLTQALQQKLNFGAVIEHSLYQSYRNYAHFQQALISALQKKLGIPHDNYYWKLKEDFSKLCFTPKKISAADSAIVEKTLTALKELNFEFAFIESFVSEKTNFKWLHVATSEVYDKFILKINPALEEKQEISAAVI